MILTVIISLKMRTHESSISCVNFLTNSLQLAKVIQKETKVIRKVFLDLVNDMIDNIKRNPQ